MKHFYLILVLISAISCSKGNKLIILRGEALGTGYQVQFFSAEEFNAAAKFDSVVEAVNESMSTYRPQSDISKINNGDTTVVVDDMFKEVLSLARTVYKETDGYYDPTVGILVNAYGFGPGKSIAQLDSVTLDSLKQYVGLNKIRLSPKGTLSKDDSAIYLDFNSIAKGYCIDRIGVMLEQNGVTDYLIELGGELRAKGINLDKNKQWAVGIENIDAPVEDRDYTRIVTLKNKGMAGSGNYRKFRIDSVTGRKFVHTINPITGKAEKSDVLSSTVIAENCATADAYATAFMALGL
ncbi:MAG: FAD:protein FMN transferase, partial [Leeuwenhoekiella sp.]